eukprot:CAMPEP_0119476932 /NCGR_PEP_ID=MMETSP1344-20130328/7262_1 /TAXON_ID=236787 /ORGANISM="Florenciella parvula, Strain CCMP2471" /LENGTH=166 /DNA_ID=CAMNT_0007510803 /DNA_START=80 /DNA_END=581 /DNA_ORIENTATION=+
MTTPLLFLAKFIFKKYRYGSDLTAVIKIRLIREVMPKRDLAAFLHSRDERRSSRRRSLTSRRSAGRSSSQKRADVEEVRREVLSDGRAPPLVREVMPKRDLAKILRSRDERRSSNRRSLTALRRKSTRRSLSADGSTGRTAKPPGGVRKGAQPGGISEGPTHQRGP